MKKTVIIFFIIIAFLITCIFVYKTYSPISSNTTNKQSNIDKTTVSYNGWIHTNGANLENEKNEKIQLKGLSSHGIEWFSDVITFENLENLKKTWGINVFRIAMYTDSHGSGYIYNPNENREKVYKIIDMATSLDMYVVVDWHILNDNNPQLHKQEAKVFFDEVSKKYSNTPNVIYEICNEPNGNEVTWERHIKPYAEEIIPIIRNNSEKSLIIVGTPDWCKKLKKAADNPINFKNIAYSCHFYSGTHGSELREQIDYCIEKNIPIFVSECGLTNASGDGEVYFDKFSEWINYLNSKNISWIYWSFSNKDESSAILLPEYEVKNNEFTSNIKDNTNSNLQENINFSSLENTNTTNNTNNTNSEENISIIDSNLDFNNYLTESGKFIKNIFNK